MNFHSWKLFRLGALLSHQRVFGSKLKSSNVSYILIKPPSTKLWLRIPTRKIISRNTIFFKHSCMFLWKQIFSSVFDLALSAISHKHSNLASILGENKHVLLRNHSFTFDTIKLYHPTEPCKLIEHFRINFEAVRGRDLGQFKCNISTHYWRLHYCPTQPCD